MSKRKHEEQSNAKNKKQKIEKLESPLENGCMSNKFKLPDNLVKQYKCNSSSFNELWSLKPEERGKVKIYGKVIDVPRWQLPVLNDYHFSQMDHVALKEVPEILKPIFDWVQTTSYAKDKDGPFNQILVNGYENGTEYIGRHSDNEEQLKKNSAILSISLGETRTFRIRDKKTKSKILDVTLDHGDVVVMEGEMQKKYTHEITKVGGEKGKKMKRRINLTFRKFK